MTGSLPAVLGHGNWKEFNLPLEAIYAAAAEWKQVLSGVERPWLCWNVSSRWCVLQQRLVKDGGAASRIIPIAQMRTSGLSAKRIATISALA